MLVSWQTEAQNISTLSFNSSCCLYQGHGHYHEDELQADINDPRISSSTRMWPFPHFLKKISHQILRSRHWKVQYGSCTHLLEIPKILYIFHLSNCTYVCVYTHIDRHKIKCYHICCNICAIRKMYFWKHNTSSTSHHFAKVRLFNVNDTGIPALWVGNALLCLQAVSLWEKAPLCHKTCKCKLQVGGYGFLTVEIEAALTPDKETTTT